MQHSSKAHRHTCGPTSRSYITTLVVPHHHTCGPTSQSHITILVVPHRGPTSPHLWSHITTLVVPHHHTCGTSTKGDWRWTCGRQGVWPSLNVGHGARAVSSSSSFRCSGVGQSETSSSLRQLCVSPQIFLGPPPPPLRITVIPSAMILCSKDISGTVNVSESK